MSAAVAYLVHIRCGLKAQKRKKITGHEIATVKDLAHKLPGLTLPLIPNRLTLWGTMIFISLYP